jgi:hypothetical protein
VHKKVRYGRLLTNERGATQPSCSEAAVSDTPSVASFLALLQVFKPHFTAPTYQTFLTLACGWVLSLGRHTITAVVRAASAVGRKHIRSFHRFFSTSVWQLDALGLRLVGLLDALVPKDQPLVVAIDDTLGRHTGKKIAAASMHRDPLLSTRTRTLFHWGHVWVVLGITVRAFDKTWCLPVLFRLYRSHKRCQADGHPHVRCTEFAAQLVALLAATLPQRRLIVLGDAAYANSSLIKGRPRNVTFIGRSRLDAALYAPAPPRRPGQMGRPRVRGPRLPSPKAQAATADARWSLIEVNVYGRLATVKVLVLDALWYVVAGSERMRLIVVRGFPGHDRDDALVCTDPSMSPAQIVEGYCKRWSLEVTFHETKGKLGFEEPQNRTERAVERTAPFALLLYSLVVLWYVQSGHKLRAARPAAMPWYSSKVAPAFSDMLATLRRASWAARLFDPHGNDSTFKKRVEPLLACLDAAA